MRDSRTEGRTRNRERAIEIKMERERERERKVAAKHAREAFFSLSIISPSLPSSLSLPTFTRPLTGLHKHTALPAGEEALMGQGEHEAFPPGEEVLLGTAEHETLPATSLYVPVHWREASRVISKR
jgi:hypothetical protein